MITPNLVGEDWFTGTQSIENINPSDTSDVIGSYASADAALVDRAVEAAKEGQKAWLKLGIQARSDILDRIGTTILNRKGELGELLAREEGKILAEATGEVIRAGQIFKFFGGELLRQSGELIDSVRPGLEVAVTRGPVGVVGLITPWNFPIAIPAWKIAPALAWGNAVIIKPAELVPASAHALVSIMVDEGVPLGAVNLLMGPGRVIGQAMVDHPGIDAISFTGSVGTGRKVAAGAVARGAKVQLEMGGKNPLVVLDDANLDAAVECAANGAFFSTGQRCTASSRLIVTDGIHDAFVKALAARTADLKVGPALDPASQVGPVVDEAQFDKDRQYIDIAKDQGGTLAAGGDRVKCDTDGWFLQPALITDTDNTMRINREEVFGPVASVIRVRDFEEALSVANDTEFGLSSGIMTTSLKHATEFRRRAEAGMVMVNAPTAGVDYHVPFGGTKGSSYGPREQGSYAREFYSTVKTSYTAW